MDEKEIEDTSWILANQHPTRYRLVNGTFGTCLEV